MSAGAAPGPRPATPTGYELVRPVGTGASGVVWEAVQHSTGRSVALKLLDVDATDTDTRRRFDRERRAMASMAAHPNVVTVLDAGIDGGRAWLAMELCARGSLAARLGREGPLDVRSALETLVAVAGALGAAHDRGIVHCDVKPGNILLTDYGVPAVGDFGIVRVAASPTTTASVSLTLDYAAPELLDDGPHTPASDVYSLGTTMWELLTGRSPFRGVAAAAVVHRILTRPLPNLPAHVPPAVTQLVRDMTAKDPADRPASMAEVAARAAALLRAPDPAMPASVIVAPPVTAAAPTRPSRADQPTWRPGSRPAGSASRSRPVRRPTPWLAAAVATLSLVVTVSLGLLWKAGTFASAAPSAPEQPSATAAASVPASDPPTATAPTAVQSAAPAQPPPVVTTAPSGQPVRAPLRVYNNSLVEGLGAKAKADFEAAGWTVTDVAAYTVGNIAHSTAYFRPGTYEEAAAQELGREFGLRVEPRFAGLDQASAGVIVIVTEDYAATGGN